MKDSIVRNTIDLFRTHVYLMQLGLPVTIRLCFGQYHHPRGNFVLYGSWTQLHQRPKPKKTEDSAEEFDRSRTSVFLDPDGPTTYT